MGYFKILMGAKVFPIKTLILSTFYKRNFFLCDAAIAHRIYILQRDQLKNTKKNMKRGFVAFYAIKLAENIALE